jgi:hypothetical protein
MASRTLLTSWHIGLSILSAGMCRFNLEREVKKSLMVLCAMAAAMVLASFPAAAQPQPDDIRYSTNTAVVTPAPAFTVEAASMAHPDPVMACYQCDTLTAGKGASKPAKPVKKDGSKKSKVMASGPGDEDGGGDAGTPPEIRRMLT